MKELYGMADIFVMASYREGLSRSIMEAMASGLPCIASKIRGNIDLINAGSGFLCEARNVLEFAEKIMLWAEDSALRRKLGQATLM